MPRAESFLAEETLIYISFKEKKDIKGDRATLDRGCYITNLSEVQCKDIFAVVASSTSDFTYTGKQLHQGRWNCVCVKTDLSESKAA